MGRQHRITFNDLSVIVWRNRTHFELCPLVGGCYTFSIEVTVGLHTALKWAVGQAFGRVTRYHYLHLYGGALKIRRVRPINKGPYYEIQALNFGRMDAKWQTDVTRDLRKDIKSHLSQYRTIEANRQLVNSWQQRK